MKELGEALQKEGARRSVSIRPELNARLRDFIAACMRSGIDMDYTKAFNLFAELGSEWLEDATPSELNKARSIFETYLSYSKFEGSEALAEWREYDEFRRWKLKATELKKTRKPSLTALKS